MDVALQFGVSIGACVGDKASVGVMATVGTTVGGSVGVSVMSGRVGRTGDTAVLQPRMQNSTIKIGLRFLSIASLFLFVLLAVELPF